MLFIIISVCFSFIDKLSKIFIQLNKIEFVFILSIFFIKASKNSFSLNNGSFINKHFPYGLEKYNEALEYVEEPFAEFNK